MSEITVRQEEIEVAGSKVTVTHIPTATSGSWYTVHDVCEVWGAVAIDLDGTVLGWRSPPPSERFRAQIEQAIREAFQLPAH